MNRKFIFQKQQAEDFSGETIARFLTKQGWSSQNLKDLRKRPDSIWVNGKNVYQNYQLQPEDILIVTIIEEASSEKIVPVELPFSVVYEDEDLIIVNKPADMPIHPSLNNYRNSLANALMYYYEQQGLPFVFRCMNRLDRDTSGLTVVAKNAVSAGILGKQMAAASCGNNGKSLKREYLAIVRGETIPPEGTIDAPIARKGESIIERCVDFENGEHAVTHYRVLRTGNGHSLLKIWLETGRTHQIRVHLKYVGFPLVGDYLYNPDMEYIQRQALHSYRLTFEHPITGQAMVCTAPLPADMEAVLLEKNSNTR